MNDFLEQLAEMEVGPPPATFDRELHERLNRSLLVQHLMDLATGGLPWALLHFARAVAGVVAFTLTGKFYDDSR
jgi:hypothetical protein